jgi:hypothetical protein
MTPMTPIDDPIAAKLSLDQSEKRSELIPFKKEVGIATTALLTVAAAASAGPDAFALKTAAVVVGSFQALAAILGTRRQQEFVTDLYDEFRSQGVTQEVLEQRLSRAKAVVHELVAESIVRAAEAKSREAVRRIAKLLTKVLMTDEEVQIEEARAMLSIAASLLELDAVALGRMFEQQSPAVTMRKGAIDINDARESWTKLRDKWPSIFMSPTINAAGSRLQAYGLVMRVEVGPQAFGLDTYVFSITAFGIQFCRWCVLGIN